MDILALYYLIHLAIFLSLCFAVFFFFSRLCGNTLCRRYHGYISAALVLGGVDSKGPHLYSIWPHGSTDKLPFVTMGKWVKRRSPITIKFNVLMFANGSLGPAGFWSLMSADSLSMSMWEDLVATSRWLWFQPGFYPFPFLHNVGSFHIGKIDVWQLYMIPYFECGVKHQLKCSACHYTSMSPFRPVWYGEIVLLMSYSTLYKWNNVGRMADRLIQKKWIPER